MVRHFQVVFIIAFFTLLNNIANAVAVQKTFGLIKPSGLAKQTEIKSIIRSYGLKIYKSKKLIMSEQQFNKLYYMHKDKPFFNELKKSLVNKEVEALILLGEDAVNKYRLAINDVRAKYAINKTENAIHGSDSLDRAHEEICIFFDCKKQQKNLVKTNNSDQKNKNSAKQDSNDVNNAVNDIITNSIEKAEKIQINGQEAKKEN